MTLARIILPWPPSATSPNASGQGQWRRKASAAKGYKLACWALCAAEKIRPVDAIAVDVLVTFCPPSRRRFDLDNALSRCKQGLDAVAEAIAVDDSQWRRITLERGDACRDGAVIVHIMEAEACSVPEKWRNQQAFTAALYEDGWGTPNTYCNKFRPLISGPAVYLLLLVKTETYREAMVAYVGMSARLKQRIANHNILPELERPGYWPMVWFKPTPKTLLRETEASLIASYDPPWNIQGRCRGVPLQ